MSYATSPGRRRSPLRSSGTAPTPFVARIADMREVEARYQHVRPADRSGFHLDLPFYTVLVKREREQLRACFPRELHGDPLRPSTPPEARVTWDFRARQLTLRMLDFAQRMVARGLHLAYRFEPTSPEAALVLTANGSLVELSATDDEDGLRAFRYEPGISSSAAPHDSGGIIRGALKIGERLDMGLLTTTEVVALAVATGAAPQQLPRRHEATAPGQISAVDRSNFAALVRELRASSRDPERFELVTAELLGQARVLQRGLVIYRGGYHLGELDGFVSSRGSRYRIRRVRGSMRFDLVRSADGGVSRALPDVILEGQVIVPGAPLALVGRTDGRLLGVIEEIAWVVPRRSRRRRR